MTFKEKYNKEVENVKEQIIKIYHPEKIILFGSVAIGKKEPRDIDLFIIKKNPPEIGVDRIRQLDALIKYKIATDFIVYKPEEVKERLAVGDPFIKNILEKGKILYSGS